MFFPLQIAYLDRMNLGDKVQIWDIEFARLGMWQQPDLDYAIGKDTCEGGYVVAEVRIMQNLNQLLRILVLRRR